MVLARRRKDSLDDRLQNWATLSEFEREMNVAIAVHKELGDICRGFYAIPTTIGLYDNCMMKVGKCKYRHKTDYKYLGAIMCHKCSYKK